MILAGALVALVFACGLALSIVRAGDGEVPATMPTLEGPGARHNAVYPEQELPLKFFYAGPMFRQERPQKGRQRQFHQIGVELFGVPEPAGDVEIIACGQRSSC